MALQTCKECGNRVSIQAVACPQCGVPIKKKTSPVAWGCATLIFSIFLIAVIGMLSPVPPEPGADFKAKFVAQNLIDDWKRGDSGSQHWKDGIALQNLFSVRDYEHISSGGWKLKNGTWEPNRAWHRFRIKSSTKGGFPIEKLWDINLEKFGTEWKIVLITEVQP